MIVMTSKVSLISLFLFYNILEIFSNIEISYQKDKISLPISMTCHAQSPPSPIGYNYLRFEQIMLF